MSNHLIELKNIDKSYPMGQFNVEVLKDLSLTIDSSSLTAVTGPSGAGKSTLIHIIGGLDKPSAGGVYFQGQNVYKLKGTALDKYRNTNIGFVFQFHYLLDDFSAVENVTMPAILGGMNQAEAAKRAEELLVMVGLQDRLKHYPSELSGGEQQRVSVARALMNKPSLILADEPTGNLDRANSEIVQDLLFGLKKLGIAVVIVTHDLTIAEKCDKIVRLSKA